MKSFKLAQSSKSTAPWLSQRSVRRWFGWEAFTLTLLIIYLGVSIVMLHIGAISSLSALIRDTLPTLISLGACLATSSAGRS
jgi:hypothetical protein